MQDMSVDVEASPMDALGVSLVQRMTEAQQRMIHLQRRLNLIRDRLVRLQPRHLRS